MYTLLIDLLTLLIYLFFSAMDVTVPLVIVGVDLMEMDG